MPDPKIRPLDFRAWIAWRVRQGGRPPHPKAVAINDAMRLLKALADELYEAALDSVIEISGEAFLRGLLHTGPAVIRPEMIEACRPELTQTVEFPDLTLRLDLILTPRWSGGQAPQYRNLRFRLAKPAAFADHLTGKPRRPPSISLKTLVRLLIEDEIFQRHREEHLLPAANFLKAVAELRYPDFAVPRDNVLRVALGQSTRSRDRPDPRVREMYGEPQSGPPPKWARDLLISLKIGHAP